MNKYTEIIDKYLLGLLNAEDKMEFERMLQADAALKAEYELQKQVMQGIEQAALRGELRKGFKKGAFRAKSGKLFVGIVIAALAMATLWVVKNKMFSKPGNIRYELNEENKKQWADADRHLSPEMFNIAGSSDTVIETKGGIIITIPAGAFINSKGDAVTGALELEVKEALDPLSIMKAGLSTTSNGGLLETGGMFYINARQNGGSLLIDATKPLHASIPDLNPGKPMLLFEGQRTAGGQINWVNPVALEKDLETVDILSLDFYPPHFLDSLNQLGFDIKNKTLTDSIYYSFVCGGHADSVSRYDNDDVGEARVYRKAQNAFAVPATAADGEKLFKQNCAVCHALTSHKLTGPGLAGIMDRVPQPAAPWLVRYIMNNEKVLKSGDLYANKIFRENGKAAMSVFEGQLTEADVLAIISYVSHGAVQGSENSGSLACEIEPARIHAIWDKKFNNTLLATKAFEARLKAIFNTCNHSILDLYLLNMDKKMYQVDSLASRMLGENESREIMSTFYEFYLRRDGGVRISSKHMKKLQAYMKDKRQLYHETALSILKKMYEKENIQDEKALQQWLAHNQAQQNRDNDNFNRELDLNMKEAYRQLGKTLNPPGNYLDAELITTGWKNVDAFVYESTRDRSTLDYTDKESGKKAVIKYEPLVLNIRGIEQYDRVLAYLIPDKLNSFHRMPQVAGGFKENLNELMQYGAVVFGFKGDVTYIGQVAVAKPGETTVTLAAMTKSDIAQYSQMNAGAAVDLVSELNYQLFEQKENRRKAAFVKREEVRSRLWPVVFPCGSMQAAPAAALFN